MRSAETIAPIVVHGAHEPYPVLVNPTLNESIEELRHWVVGNQILLVTAENLITLANPIKDFFESLDFIKQVDFLVVKDGDDNKSLDTANQLWEALIKHGHKRDTTLVAIGGGVIGDMVGFVAATYMRGVSWINFPTTLLAQVDAAIGGKTAVNHALGKNLIGAFHAPNAVIVNTNLLDTLPNEEYIAGLAEVVKYGLSLDKLFFEWLNINIKLILKKEPDTIAHMVARCCEIKAKVVSSDYKEKGQRALLNFGHTIGHAIESVMNYQIRHGEAVSIGMVGAMLLSRDIGFASQNYDQAIKLLDAFGLPLKLPKGLDKDEILQHLLRDKKHLSSAPIRMVLLPELGHAKIVDDLNLDQISSVLTKLGA